MTCQRALFAIACVVASLGCSGPTELVVVTGSDLRVPRELDEIVFEIEEPDGRRSTRVAPLTGQDALELPVTVVLLHSEGPLGPVVVRAIGRVDGVEVVRRGAVGWFLEGQSVLVPLDLRRSCLDVTCPLGTTCVAGACAALPHDGSDAGVSPLDGGPPPVDAARPADDAGSPPEDAGLPCASGCACVQSCEGGCECDHGCLCDLYCGAGAECTSGKCKDPGTVCTLSAQGADALSHTCESGARCTIDARGVSNVDRITCKTGADCEVDCTGASNCELECQDDSTCLLDCSDTSNCFVSDCGELDDEGSDLRSCGDGVLVCRRACP